MRKIKGLCNCDDCIEERLMIEKANKNKHDKNCECCSCRN
jgi:hypothetical protein